MELKSFKTAVLEAGLKALEVQPSDPLLRALHKQTAEAIAVELERRKEFWVRVVYTNLCVNETHETWELANEAIVNLYRDTELRAETQHCHGFSLTVYYGIKSQKGVAVLVDFS